MRTRISRQRGTTLIVALIMLVLLTLFAVSSFNTANTNLRIVGNMQQKTEALNSAQEAIETALSTPQFMLSPTNALSTPCGNTPNKLCHDVTGDSVPEFTTTLAPPPACITVRPIKNQDLVLTNVEDLGCSAQQQQQFGVVGAVTGDSLCANTVWQIQARTVSETTGIVVNVTQGVGVRVSMDNAGSC
jgi:Tfp pilus assembly protein PilX